MMETGSDQVPGLSSVLYVRTRHCTVPPGSVYAGTSADVSLLTADAIETQSPLPDAYSRSYPVGNVPVSMICSHANRFWTSDFTTVFLGLIALALESCSTVEQVIQSLDAIVPFCAVADTIHWIVSEEKVPLGIVTCVSEP